MSEEEQAEIVNEEEDSKLAEFKAQIEAKVTDEIDKVLDQVDEKFTRLYETIELKLKHVSKSFDGKFDNYSTVLTESQRKIDEQIQEITAQNETAKKERDELRQRQLDEERKSASRRS